MTITQGFLDHKIFSIVSDTAAELGVRAFVIGGYVRDCFLGRPSTDIDIVVEGSGIALAEAVSSGSMLFMPPIIISLVMRPLMIIATTLIISAARSP